MSNRLYLLCWRLNILILTVYPDFWKHQKRYTILTTPGCRNIQNEDATRSTSQRQKGVYVGWCFNTPPKRNLWKPCNNYNWRLSKVFFFTKSLHRWPLSSIGNHLCLSSVARASKCENGSGLLKPYQSDPQRWVAGAMGMTCWWGPHFNGWVGGSSSNLNKQSMFHVHETCLVNLEIFFSTCNLT